MEPRIRIMELVLDGWDSVKYPIVHTECHLSAFGSWWIEYRDDGLTRRLVYDGKDGWLVRQMLANDDWQDEIIEQGPKKTDGQYAELALLVVQRAA